MVPQAARKLQVSALRGVHGDPENQHRQDPKIYAARDGKVAVRQGPANNFSPLATRCLPGRIADKLLGRRAGRTGRHRNEADDVTFPGDPNGAQQQKIGAHSCVQVSSAPPCSPPPRCGRERPAPRQSAARAPPQLGRSSTKLPPSCAYATTAAGTICAAIVASPAAQCARGAPIGVGIARAVAAAGGIATNAGFTTDL